MLTGPASNDATRRTTRRDLTVLIVLDDIARKELGLFRLLPIPEETAILLLGIRLVLIVAKRANRQMLDPPSSHTDEIVEPARIWPPPLRIPSSVIGRYETLGVRGSLSISQGMTGVKQPT